MRLFVFVPDTEHQLAEAPAASEASEASMKLQHTYNVAIFDTLLIEYLLYDTTYIYLAHSC